MRGALALVTLAACGRIGFAPLDDDDIVLPPGTITVEVRRTSGSMTPNAPVADAYVVFVDSDGATQLELTDAAGRARADVTGATTVHVAYEEEPDLLVGLAAPEWQVTSFEAIGGGATLLVGGATPEPATSSLTITLPSEPGALDYDVVGSLMCRLEGAEATPTVLTSYHATCEGQSVRLFANARSKTASSWMSLGAVHLAAGSTLAPGGTWLPPTQYVVRIPDVPAGMNAGATLLDEEGALDLFGLESSMTTPSGPDVVVTLEGPPIQPEQIMVALSGENVAAVARTSVGTPVGGEYVFDLRLLPRTIATLDIDRATATMTWSYGPSTPAQAHVVVSRRSFETAAGVPVEWVAYQPATRTQVEGVVLPAPLETLIPEVGAELSATVTLLANGDPPYTETVLTLDNELHRAVTDYELVPLGIAGTSRSITVVD